MNGAGLLQAPRLRLSLSIAVVCAAAVIGAGAMATSALASSATTHDQAGGLGPDQGKFQLISSRPDGRAGDHESYRPQISPDGRLVLFGSYADNLVPDDTNGADDVFLRDLSTGVTQLLSRAPDGTPGNKSSGWYDMSTDGRYVVYASYATNLVSGDTNIYDDVFRLDRATGTTTMITRSTTGGSTDGNSDRPTVSDDGRYVTYESGADDLVAGDTNRAWDVFVQDVETGVTTLVTRGIDGAPSVRGGQLPRMSSDGRYIVFFSGSNDLTHDSYPGGVPLGNMFVFDRELGVTELITRALDGTPAGDSCCDQPDISGDGQLIAYSSNASDLVDGDTNGRADVFTFHLATGATTMISRGPDGTPARGGDSYAPSVSNDGGLIAFTSKSGDISAGAAKRQRGIYLFTVSSGQIALVSGAKLNAIKTDADYAAVAPTGFVVFQWSYNESSLDKNRGPDVYGRQMA